MFKLMHSLDDKFHKRINASLSGKHNNNLSMQRTCTRQKSIYLSFKLMPFLHIFTWPFIHAVNKQKKSWSSSWPADTSIRCTISDLIHSL